MRVQYLVQRRRVFLYSRVSHNGHATVENSVCVCVCVAAVHYTRVYTYAPTLCYIRARAFWLLRPIIINGVQK